MLTQVRDAPEHERDERIRTARLLRQEQQRILILLDALRRFKGEFQGLTSQILLTRLGRAVTQALMQAVDELLKQACDETSNEMKCMSIKVGWKKASRLVSSSRGVPEGPTIADVSAVSSISSVRRTNASRSQDAQDSETTRVDGSMRQERLEQLGMSSSESKSPSARLRDGDIREQRPDAALDVLSAVLHQHGRGAERLHNNDRFHQTCGPVNQQRHVCVERCPLITRHSAIRSGDSCGG